MSSLTLSSGVKTPSEQGNQGFSILDEYLQPSSSTTPSAAAHSIHGLAKPLLSGPDAENLENFVWEFWVIFINIAKQIPCDSPSQDRLVELVKALSEIPPTTIQIWGNDTRLWADLPLLGPNMREAWNPPTPNDSKEVAQGWINLNSFAARLLTLDATSWKLFAVWALRDALEEESSGSKLECDVVVAREWFKHGGPILREQVTANDDKEDRMMAGGTLYQGPAKVSLERWVFWKERLNKICEQGGEVGQVASAAKVTMDQVEGN
ncbi:hypothetical protein BBP40_003016 [Aspergillus hancockii]|nr:hypothetical protein BBP40_003016 [Aspergillus hancockii]